MVILEGLIVVDMFKLFSCFVQPEVSWTFSQRSYMNSTLIQTNTPTIFISFRSILIIFPPTFTLTNKFIPVSFFNSNFNLCSTYGKINICVILVEKSREEREEIRIE